jgi:hypothetical protein
LAARRRAHQAQNAPPPPRRVVKTHARAGLQPDSIWGKKKHKRRLGSVLLSRAVGVGETAFRGTYGLC